MATGARRIPEADLGSLRRAAEAVRAHFAIPGRSSIIATGSMAEGFGNPQSDIDLLVIVDGGGDESVSRGVLNTAFDEGGRLRRVEVSLRTTGEIAEFAERMNGISPGRLEEREDFCDEDLRTFHGLLFGICLEGPERAAKAGRALDAAHFERLCASWHREQAVVFRWRAFLALHMGQCRRARSYGRSALLSAAKHWAARHGEAYLPRKWVLPQVARAGLGAQTVSALKSALGSGAADAGGFLAEVQRLVALLVEDGGPTRPADEALAIVPDVTQWPLGEEVYLLRADRDLYRLDQLAGSLWRALCREPAVWKGWRGEEARLLGELHRHGLVAFRSDATGWRWHRRESPEAAGGRLPFVTPTGAAFPDRRKAAVRWIPLAARTFVGAGMDQLFHGTRVQAAREDALGAYQARQWEVLAECLGDLARNVCRCVLSGHGVYPLPSDPIAEVAHVPGLEAFAQRAARLEFLSIAGEEDAPAAAEAVESLLDAVPDVLQNRHLRSCYDSFASFAAVLAIGLPWAALGRHLGLPVPNRDAIGVAEVVRDQLAGDDRGSAPRMDPDTMLRLASMRRDLSLRRAVAERRAQARSAPPTAGGEEGLRP